MQARKAVNGQSWEEAAPCRTVGGPSLTLVFAFLSLFSPRVTFLVIEVLLSAVTVMVCWISFLKYL